MILCVRGTFRVSRRCCAETSPHPPHPPHPCNPSANLAQHGSSSQQGEAVGRRGDTALWQLHFLYKSWTRPLILNTPAAAFSPALTRFISLAWWLRLMWCMQPFLPFGFPPIMPCSSCPNTLTLHTSCLSCCHHTVDVIIPISDTSES